jgi:hypothetical protein
MKKESSIIATIPYEEVCFKWVSHHWDINLNGICIYENELCEFETFFVYDKDEEDEELQGDYDAFVRIYKLNFLQKLKWLWRKRKFELCVGYYWSYKDGERLNKKFKHKKKSLSSRFYKWYYY